VRKGRRTCQHVRRTQWGTPLCCHLSRTCLNACQHVRRTQWGTHQQAGRVPDNSMLHNLLISGTQKILLRTGMSWRKAHPKNPRSVTESEKGVLKKTARLARRYAGLGYGIPVQDESTFALGGNRTWYGWDKKGILTSLFSLKTRGGNKARYGWHKKGTTGNAPAVPSRKRRHVFGVPGDGRFYFMFYDMQN